MIAARWLRFGILQRMYYAVNVRVTALVLAPHRPSRLLSIYGPPSSATQPPCDNTRGRLRRGARQGERAGVATLRA